MRATDERVTLLDVVHLTTLSAFAVTQPLLDLLGRNASFFVAHRAERGSVLLVAAISVLLVPATLTLVRFGVAQVSGHAGRLIHLASIGLLFAVAIVPPVARAAGVGWVVASALALLIAAGVATAYHRSSGVRRFITVLSPAPVVFLALFLFGSQVRDLLFPPAERTGAAALAADRSHVPVMVVLFDELSLSSIIEPDGTIDERRYPNFARLAERSTWYRNATTSGLRTDQAVPAILTGRRVPTRQVPSSFAYPDNAFTLFSRSHRLHVHEFVTQLCPDDLCPVAGREETSGLASLLTDTAVVYGHIVLPSDAADRLLPPLGDRWAGFTRDTGGTGDGGADPVSAWLRAAIDDRETQHEGVVLERFLNDLRPDGPTPQFSWLHLQVPHPPWRYLPTGQTYPTGPDTPGYRNFRWMADQYLADEVLQRSLLQTVYADKLLGRTIDHLEEIGAWDNMMFAVISDHGATWQKQETRRDVDGPQGGGLLGVPLFVHYPGQDTGEVDDRNAEMIDVLPTIGDVTGIEIPWETQGSSLRDKATRREKRVFDGDRDRAVDYSFADSRRRAEEIEELFGRSGGKDDLYAFGRHRRLLGARPTSLEEGAKLRVDFDATPFRDLDRDARVLPALFRANLGKFEDRIPVAVAVNGRIAGVGYTYVEDDEARIAVMLSATYFRAGRNEVEVYRIDGSFQSAGRP